MAYLVGLTATDGCLLTGRRQINFKSKDRELVETYLALLGRSNGIREQKTSSGGTAFVVQFGDAKLYRWMQSIGLMPRKSLTLAGLAVPDAYLFPLVRGLLDGDGSVINKTSRADTAGGADYCWEYLQTKFYSASRPHLEWLQQRLRVILGINGYLSEVPAEQTPPRRHAFFHLRYSKRESLLLLPRIYPPSAPCLERKRAIWSNYQARHGLSDSVE